MGSVTYFVLAWASEPEVMLQINLKLKSGENITIGTDSTWMAFNGDVHRKPGAPQHGHSAGTGYLEYIDARQEPVGWANR